MADQKKELYIRVNGQLVEVTQDVYLTFYRMKRRERFVVEKDQRAGVVLYGSSFFPKLDFPTLENPMQK